MELVHTCYRITDPLTSVAFYEALGFEKRRELPIRDDAITIFMGLPGDGDRLQLTYHVGVDKYEIGTGYDHIAVTVDDIHATLEMLEEQVVVLKLLAAQQEAGKVTVRIGQETDSEQMAGTSVVTTTYGTSGKVFGGMGVLGPTRMDYPGTIANVAAVALYIGEVLGTR